MTGFSSCGPFRTVRPLVLASGSPRRRAFLEQAGLIFETLDLRGAEPRPLPDETPAVYAERAARAKAEAGAAQRPESAVLAADTIVVLPETAGAASVVLGKPADEHDAVAMLTRLSGRTHQVITACCLIGPAHACSAEARSGPDLFHDSAEVTFAAWPQDVLRAYAATGEPLDKAGAYAVQGAGAFLISGLRGSWSTVVGLPLEPVIRLLLRRGVIAPRVASLSCRRAEKSTGIESCI